MNRQIVALHNRVASTELSAAMFCWSAVHAWSDMRSTWDIAHCAPSSDPTDALLLWLRPRLDWLT